MFFTSDNAAPVHPAVMEALSRANADAVYSYGGDRLTEEVGARLREVFEAPDAAVYLVGTGSSANGLSLATFCPPWAEIYCHEIAHIAVDECGGPEFFSGGAKLVQIGGAHGRIDPDALSARVTQGARAEMRNTPAGMVSLSNVTELGTVYSPGMVKELCAIAKTHDLPVHLDGARFANALVSAGASAAEMSWRAGVDVVSFGGTKNGLMGVEAVVIFDPAKAQEFERRRARGGHLFSKHRYLAAQMLAYLEDDLWLTLARHSNDMAARLAKGLSGVAGVEFPHPVEANMLFPRMPRALHRKAFEAGAHYYIAPHWATLDGDADEMLDFRLVTNWSTTEAEVDRFLAALT